MVHVSFDLVESFFPRVPPQRLKTEDATIPRICVAPNVLFALRSIPQCGNVMQVMKQLGLPIIVHTYYLKSENVIDNETVQKYVDDAYVTGEMWLTDPPESVYRVDYQITDFLAPMMTDKFGNREHFVFIADMKRCKYQDNWDNLFGSLYLNDREGGKIKSLKGLCTFRTLMSNLGKEEIEILKERIKANEKAGVRGQVQRGNAERGANNGKKIRRDKKNSLQCQ